MATNITVEGWSDAYEQTWQEWLNMDNRTEKDLLDLINQRGKYQPISYIFSLRGLIEYFVPKQWQPKFFDKSVNSDVILSSTNNFLFAGLNSAEIKEIQIYEALEIFQLSNSLIIATTKIFIDVLSMIERREVAEEDKNLVSGVLRDYWWYLPTLIKRLQNRFLKAELLVLVAKMYPVANLIALLKIPQALSSKDKIMITHIIRQQIIKQQFLRPDKESTPYAQYNYYLFAHGLQTLTSERYIKEIKFIISIATKFSLQTTMLLKTWFEKVYDLSSSSDKKSNRNLHSLRETILQLIDFSECLLHDGVTIRGKKHDFVIIDQKTISAAKKALEEFSQDRVLRGKLEKFIEEGEASFESYQQRLAELKGTNEDSALIEQMRTI